MYGHARCIDTVLANPTSMYGVCTVCLAGKSANTRSYTVYSGYVQITLSICTVARIESLVINQCSVENVAAVVMVFMLEAAVFQLCL
jgi:hypothetical protein